VATAEGGRAAVRGAGEAAGSERRQAGGMSGRSSAEGTYIIPCVFGPAIATYQRELVALVAERFGLTFTQRQAVPAHFTLKYHFTTPHVDQVETLLEEVARRHPPAPVAVGGFGHFFEDVVFVEVALSPAARSTLDALIRALRTLPWMPWDRYDAERLHPHMTIAEGTRACFREVWDCCRERERRFAGAFDNITILKKRREADGIDRWDIHRSFRLAG
jgi:2'-5' RNA ligase